MRNGVWWLLVEICWTLTLSLLAVAGEAEANAPVGDAVIRAPAGDTEIVITTTARLAGAIHSLTWNGQEFIDSTDHGRQLQSASNFDAGSRFVSETFNPTEAGSRADGAGERSTSRLLHLVRTSNSLQTTSQMAFWLAPGESSAGEPAKNTERLSNHLLTKRVTIGWRELPHVIQYDVTFSVPLGERHTYAQFEAVTGYMPARFSKFHAFEPATGNLVPLSDGPGEQVLPVVLATPDGSLAMGIYSPEQPAQGFEQAGYGRFRFAAERVVKWNCVFRILNKAGVPAGEYSFRNFVVVGDLEMVRRSLVALHLAHAPRADQ
ncbi:MAG: hypothetical protein SFU86_23780 [Pirellulaceae bacterium]|nr:hypothetical protein [Pirellulaceae bacterium]